MMIDPLLARLYPHVDGTEVQNRVCEAGVIDPPFAVELFPAPLCNVKHSNIASKISLAT